MSTIFLAPLALAALLQAAVPHSAPKAEERKAPSTSGSYRIGAQDQLLITVAEEPGILMNVKWDNNGDIDRISFLGEVIDGKQKITQTLPELGM